MNLGDVANEDAPSTLGVARKKSLKQIGICGAATIGNSNLNLGKADPFVDPDMMSCCFVLDCPSCTKEAERSAQASRGLAIAATIRHTEEINLA